MRAIASAVCASVRAAFTRCRSSRRWAVSRRLDRSSTSRTSTSTNGDGCSSDCRWEYCGNGTVDKNASGADVEECDDGNNVSGDGCSSVCHDEPICGNGGQPEPGEQCDDGNTTSGDGCSKSCKIEHYCGDGVLDTGEQCDTGSKNGTGSCSENCTIVVQWDDSRGTGNAEALAKQQYKTVTRL